MKVTVSVARSVIINNDVDSLHINTATKDVSSYQDALLKGLESGISLDSEIIAYWVVGQHTCLGRTHRSSCARPEWMQMLGKL